MLQLLIPYKINMNFFSQYFIIIILTQIRGIPSDILPPSSQRWLHISICKKVGELRIAEKWSTDGVLQFPAIHYSTTFFDIINIVILISNKNNNTQIKKKE
eukprot:288596_1